MCGQLFLATPSRRFNEEIGMRSKATIWFKLGGALGFGLAAMTLFAPESKADELVWATGKVLDNRGRPMSGALVAAYDDSNRVADYARTDRNGEYALAVPKRLLHLQQKHGKGFFAEVFSGVTRFVGGAAEFVANPLQAGVHAITTSQAASYANPLMKGQITAGGAVVDKVLFAISPRQKRRAPVEERKVPGVLLVKVIANDRNDLIGVNRLYWMQEETFKAGGREKKTLAAWFDPIKLADADSEELSKADSALLRFTNSRIEPSIAEVGQIVRISTRLQIPKDPEIDVVVVARNSRTGQKWEMKQDNDGYFSAEIEITKKFGKDDQTIAIVAYAADQRKPGRRANAEGAIERSGLWDVARPYLFDPLLVASRNRAEVNLTVVSAERRRN